MIVKVIVAISENNGIGKDNKLPWKCREDMLFFARNTIGSGKNAVVMGKNTWLSIGKPLRSRMNIVVSTKLKQTDGVIVTKTIEDAINHADKSGIDTLWVIGGSSLYEWFLNYEKTEEIVISKIPGNYECDTFFPDIDLANWKESYRFSVGNYGLEVFYYKNRLKWHNTYNLIE
jgi:dihydrofolate reductase